MMFSQLRQTLYRHRRLHIGPGNLADAARKGLLTDTSSFVGVCAGDCSITPAHKCVYDAGIVLDGMPTEDEFVSIRTIPAGCCAVLPVACHPNELNSKWNWLTSKWLPDSGCKTPPGPQL